MLKSINQLVATLCNDRIVIKRTFLDIVSIRKKCKFSIFMKKNADFMKNISLKNIFYEMI